MSKAMVRKQVYLTTDLDQRLRREAARQRRPEAEILREALAARLGAKRESKLDTAADALWDLVGIAESDTSDLSVRVDKVLYGKHAPRQ